MPNPQDQDISTEATDSELLLIILEQAKHGLETDQTIEKEYAHMDDISHHAECHGVLLYNTRLIQQMIIQRKIYPNMEEQQEQLPLEQTDQGWKKETGTRHLAEQPQ